MHLVELSRVAQLYGRLTRIHKQERDTISKRTIWSFRYRVREGNWKREKIGDRDIDARRFWSVPRSCPGPEWSLGQVSSSSLSAVKRAVWHTLAGLPHIWGRVLVLLKRDARHSS